MSEDPILDPSVPDQGFAALTGYRLVRWEAGLAEVEVVVEAQHLNRSGLPHGGLLATLLDAALGYTGVHAEPPAKPRRAVTLQLNVQFIGAAQLGERLVCTARMTGGGGTVFFSSGEVRNPAGRLIARADGVFKYRGLPRAAS